MPRILVVDDDDTFRDTLEVVLKRAGHEVLTARDGKEAVNVYRQQPADLVLTDLIMPNQEGVETIVELRRDYPGIKIIAMSGGGRVDAKEHLAIAEQCGARRTLTKPFTLDQILTAIREVLGES
ncbi:MAG: response regulator [Verrucomicrobia bacterium]|nr:response regulator [Verrucomicrobiota bacterium]